MEFDGLMIQPDLRGLGPRMIGPADSPGERVVDTQHAGEHHGNGFGETPAALSRLSQHPHPGHLPVVHVSPHLFLQALHSREPGVVLPQFVGDQDQ